MTEVVTPDMFWQAIPAYVERAHNLATLIIEHAVTEPTAGVEVQATVFNEAYPSTHMERTTEPTRLAELWNTPEHLAVMEVDIPIDNGRLAIEDRHAAGDYRQLRVWQYRDRAKPPLRQIDPRLWNRLQAIPKSGPDTKWIGSSTREYLGNLVIPGYVFRGWGPIPDDYSAPESSLEAYLYRVVDRMSGLQTYQGWSGVTNIPTSSFIRDAIAPPYSQSDAKLLDGHSLETYHTAKIERLLMIMGAIAKRGVR